MEPTGNAQELKRLLQTVDELTENSISVGHQTLVEEVRTSVDTISKLISAANQESLVQAMAKVFHKKERDIIETLEPVLKSLQELVESGHLNESQKTRLLIQLGKTYDSLTQWDVALDLLYRALDYCREHLAGRAEVLKHIGHIKSKQRNYNAAQSQYFASLADYIELQNWAEVAHIYLSLGFNDFERGNYPEAENQYQVALDIANTLENAEPLVGELHLMFGILATVKGELQDAMSHYKRSVESFESINDERGLSQVYYNMAVLYVDMKQLAQAGEYYHRSLEYARKCNDLYLIGFIHLSWTELALQLSDLTLAQAAYMQAFRRFGQLGSQAQLSEAYKYAAQVHYRKGMREKADPLFQRSIELAEASESRLSQAEAHYAYGLMLRDENESEAETHLNKALKLFTKLGAETDIERTKTALERVTESETESKTRRRFKRIRRS